MDIGWLDNVRWKCARHILTNRVAFHAEHNRQAITIDLRVAFG